MPSDPSPTATLRCEQCEYSNEPERVYCHNCGAKLDRSLLPKEDGKEQESPEKARERIRRITNPQSGGLGRELRTLFKVAIYAALVAAIILIARAPDGVPDGTKEPTLRLVSSDLMDAMQSPTPRAVSFSEDEVNQYFKQKLKAKEGKIPGVQFKRAYVNFRPGVIRINSENSVWGYPAFSGVEYQLAVNDGVFTATVVGGNIGRLAVHPEIMRYADGVFESLWTSLQPERANMDRMQSVKVEKERIDLVTKGATASR